MNLLKSVCSALFLFSLTTLLSSNGAAAETLDELSPFLTSQQRVEVLRAEALIEEGESEIVSGQHMADRQPSKLKPNEDIRAINERGTEMIAAGRAKVARGVRSSV